MHHRLILAGLTAGGGLLTAAFLQAAVAVADEPSATGADAFNLGGYTFDPYTSDGGAAAEGFALVHPLTSAPPLLTLGGGNPGGVLPTAPQDFEVYDPTTGTDLGSINTSETVTNLLGMTNTQFTVTDVTAADGGAAADLPTQGSVYSVLNLGNGWENVYTAIPGSAGADDSVTDTFVTPFGNVDLSSLFGSMDAAAALQPGTAFTGLEAATAAGGEQAFAIGGYTFDPFTGTGDSTTEGFASVPSLGGAAPLLSIGGASLGDPTVVGDDLAQQSFTVYDGTGADATNLGTITTGVDVTNLLGMTNTQLIVATPLGVPTESGLPATGSVYDVFNFGNGYENVYTAIPGTAGADPTVTDTLVTPFGNTDLSSLFAGMDTTALDPGAAFTGLEDATAAGGTQAFAIGNATFDPFTGTGDAVQEGFAPVYQTIGALPLLNIGGGTPGVNLGGTYFPLPLTSQDFDVYDGTGADATQVGTVHAQETVTQLLGLTNSEFTIDGVTALTGQTASELPAIGSVYDVFNFGGGFENIYTAIPGTGDADATITDIFMTPFGNIDLSDLFGGIDASALLDPGAAFDGLDVGAAAAMDPLAFLGI